MSDDLGTSYVEKIDPVTGYPMDRYGNLLNPISRMDGSVEKDWDKPGTELANFTNPYGFLEYAIGSGDDFICFDYAEIDVGPRGKFIILDATRNSETGGYIEGAQYEVMPCNTEEECKDAVRCALSMRDELPFDDVRHSRKGWNQDPLYFVRAVAHALFPIKFEKYNKVSKTFEDWTTDRMLRFGGKRMDEVLWKIVGRGE